MSFLRKKEVVLVEPAPAARAYPISMFVQAGGAETHYEMDANVCLALARGVIKNFLLGGGMPETAEGKQVSNLVKTGVRGILLAAGPFILKQLLGPGHPRPGRKDDLIEWYTDLFAKVGIVFLVQHPTILEGEKTGDIIQISRIYSRPQPDAPGSSAQSERAPASE